MKKFLLIALGGGAAVLLLMYGFAYMGAKSNDDALAALKERQGVLVMKVEGMT